MELAVKDVNVTLGKAKIVNGVSLHVGERQSRAKRLRKIHLAESHLPGQPH